MIRPPASPRDQVHDLAKASLIGRQEDPVMLIRRLLPRQHRVPFVIAFIVVRILIYLGERVVFSNGPPVGVALLITVATYALFYAVARVLGWYDAPYGAGQESPSPPGRPGQAPPRPGSGDSGR